MQNIKDLADWSLSAEWGRMGGGGMFKDRYRKIHAEKTAVLKKRQDMIHKHMGDIKLMEDFIQINEIQGKINELKQQQQKIKDGIEEYLKKQNGKGYSEYIVSGRGEYISGGPTKYGAWLQWYRKELE
jgi:hypothetical protein